MAGSATPLLLAVLLLPWGVEVFAKKGPVFAHLSDLSRRPQAYQPGLGLGRDCHSVFSETIEAERQALNGMDEEGGSDSR